MNELVKIVGKDVFTDSMVIARGTGNQHESVVSLIKTYKDNFMSFGSMEFTDLKSGKRGRPLRIYRLNEPQATLLITFLDNTDIVVQFKTELVRQFYEMRTLLQQLQSPVWQDIRQLTKEIRKKETAAIKSLVDYAKAAGSKNAERYYTSLSILADRAAGIQPKQRDSADIEHLTRLYMVENIIDQCIQDGIGRGEPYKDIYQACRIKIEQFGKLAYLHA